MHSLARFSIWIKCELKTRLENGAQMAPKSTRKHKNQSVWAAQGAEGGRRAAGDAGNIRGLQEAQGFGSWGCQGQSTASTARVLRKQKSGENTRKRPPCHPIGVHDSPTNPDSPGQDPNLRVPWSPGVLPAAQAARRPMPAATAFWARGGLFWSLGSVRR
jgi:hypothetical protein